MGKAQCLAFHPATGWQRGGLLEGPLFTPFETPFDQLTGRDLERLRETPEGWYVEYKRELPNAAAIAKTISAFANTYGGWLFIGIDEASRADAVAG